MQAIAFGRGDRGFIVVNNEDFALSERLQTGLPEGEYCDVISCDNSRPPCGNTGGKCRPTVHVDYDGFALFNVPAGEDPMIAIIADKLVPYQLIHKMPCYRREGGAMPL